MKRLTTLALCAFGIACAIAACGGGGGASTSPTVTAVDDKLTIVGSGD